MFPTNFLIWITSWGNNKTTMTWLFNIIQKCKIFIVSPKNTWIGCLGGKRCKFESHYSHLRFCNIKISFPHKHFIFMHYILFSFFYKTSPLTLKHRMCVINGYNLNIYMYVLLEVICFATFVMTIISSCIQD